MNLSLIVLFIRALPDLIKLLQMLDRIRVEQDTDRKVTDDLKTLHEAFAEKNADKVTALFSGAPVPPPVGGDGMRS